MRILAFVTAALICLCGVAAAQAPSADVFAADLDFHGASLSPSGRYVAGVANTPNGEVLVVYDWASGQGGPIAAADNSDPEYRVRINWVAWKGDDRLIYSLTAIDQRLNLDARYRWNVTRLQAINRTGDGVTELMGGRRRTEWNSTRLMDELPSDPDHVLVIASANDGLGFAVWRANIHTGEGERVESASRYVYGWYVNRDGQVVMRVEYDRSGRGYTVARRAPGDGQWRDVLEVFSRDFEDNIEFFPVGAGPRPELMYVRSRRPDQNFGAIYLFNVATGEYGDPVHASPTGDVYIPYIHPRTQALAMVCVYETKRSCRAVDPDFQTQWASVAAQLRRYGETHVIDMSDDSSTWLLYVEAPDNPGTYVVYSRTQSRLSVVSPVRTGLPAEALGKTEIVNYQTRDGAALWGYLTRPPGAAAGPLPLIMMPHGGPEGRDYYDYDFLVQFLATRGYAVFQPQFRGSEGFGRAFTELGYGQWGGRMQDDVTDAVKHLTSTGVADAQRVCIFGISYGGYSALAGAAFTPELYRCAASIAGDTDLNGSTQRIRLDYGSNSLAFRGWQRTLGSVEDHYLDRISPAKHANNIRVPILLIHADEDRIVYPEQSERMDRALRDAGKSVRFVRLGHGGHPYGGWYPEDRKQMLNELDAFFAANLQPQ